MSGTTVKKVTFESHGETIAGRLFAPAFNNGPAPGVVIIGPMTFQKEQAPTLYADCLSALGFAVLVFDPRYRGESGGKPRCYEDPFAKAKDMHAAVTFLSKQSDVDAKRIASLGVCMGSSTAIQVAADDPLVKIVATVTGQYRDPAADAAWLGGETAIAERLARGKTAKAEYEKTRKVDYVPAVDFERSDVGMPGQLVWSWYQLWADRGLWENRYAVMSDVPLLTYNGLPHAARLTKPFLMIHSDLCALPDAARRHFAVVPTPDKKLLWEGQTRHLQYYDDPAVIYRAACNVADWFLQHLGPGIKE